jgi:transcriptional regulator with XRE-family HTH domain
MAHLENYLKAYRKKSGLTQREVVFLLGCRDGAQVSRYEKRRRLPPLETALALEAVFGVPVAELFAGVRERVGREIGKRLLELRSRLQTQTDKGSEARVIAHKLRWFGERHGMKAGDSPAAS